MLLTHILACKSDYGRIRHLYNDKGMPVAMATPGQPVQIVGLSDLPLPGDGIFVQTKERVEVRV